MDIFGHFILVFYLYHDCIVILIAMLVEKNHNFIVVPPNGLHETISVSKYWMLAHILFNFTMKLNQLRNSFQNVLSTIKCWNV
jgi:hypothetical protein